MPGGRPVKYMSLEEAREARLASKRAYRQRNLNKERLKSRKRTHALTGKDCHAAPSVGALATPNTTPDKPLPELHPVRVSGLKIPEIIPIWDPVCSETNCMDELRSIWNILIGDTVVYEWDDFLQAEDLTVGIAQTHEGRPPEHPEADTPPSQVEVSVVTDTRTGMGSDSTVDAMNTPPPGSSNILKVTDIHTANDALPPADVAGIDTAGNGENGEPRDPLSTLFKWDFPLFVPTNRAFQFSLHPEGVRYLEARLPEYDKVEGPQGVTVDEYESRLIYLRLKWKQGVSETYLSHYPMFNWNSVLPPNPSARQLKAAKRRVLVKIDNMLARKHNPEQGPDVIEQLFHVAKRPTASVLWARACKDYQLWELPALEAAGWTPQMTWQHVFPIQTRVRAKLFRELSDEDQYEWREKAKKYKAHTPSKEDILGALPKLFSMIGDAIADKVGWFLEIRAAGLGADDKPHFFVECYKPVVDGKRLDYSDFPAAVAYDNSFPVSVAAAHMVDVKVVNALPPWKPEIAKPVPKTVQLTLMNMVDLDENGLVSTPFDELGEIVQGYVEQSYAHVHLGRSRTKKAPKPNWDEIAKREGERLRELIDPERLPPQPFEFRSPRSLRERALLILAQWIINGEAGKREQLTHFQWQGQQDMLIVRDLNPPCKAPAKNNVTNNEREDAIATSQLKTQKRKKTEIAMEEEGEGAATSEPKAKKPKRMTSGGGNRKPKKGVTQAVACITNPVAEPQANIAVKLHFKENTSINAKTTQNNKRAKTTTRKNATSDSDSDSDDEAKEGAFVVKGKASVPHAGNYERWFFDFKKCQEDLDWEAQSTKVMECDVISAARFVEATELQECIVLGASLNIVRPADVHDQGVADLVEAILDSSKILPALSSFGRVKNWAEAGDILLMRAEAFIPVLTKHVTDQRWSFVKVGGAGSLFPALRCLEFVWRTIETRPGAMETMGVKQFCDGAL
ncbi:hypothetical protein M422DRAFT_252882 [Sphaerobolus stellatus SS14]|uniref:Uncharacterized protein n=1 Tax=Sphaerobolus stellatus (strain SS14) TaxID=990650 RepID=A0A0C9VXL5_SPHS4|nr:hypothetical protein M422DRAFT_252882 [Sphaerobolus stellatus SS14]